jgi:glucose-1-phosphate thymidylyltransferase
LIGVGSQFGIQLAYAEQPSPEDLTQAFIIEKAFIAGDDVCFGLGDNIFYGAVLRKLLSESVRKVQEQKQAVIFGDYVENIERYVIAEFNAVGKVLSIEEKSKAPKSNYAVVGLYFHPNSVVQGSENVQSSTRGELQIILVKQNYLAEENLNVQIISWF